MLVRDRENIQSGACPNGTPSDFSRSISAYFCLHFQYRFVKEKSEKRRSGARFSHDLICKSSSLGTPGLCYVSVAFSVWESIDNVFPENFRKLHDCYHRQSLLKQHQVRFALEHFSQRFILSVMMQGLQRFLIKCPNTFSPSVLFLKHLTVFIMLTNFYIQFIYISTMSNDIMSVNLKWLYALEVN